MKKIIILSFILCIPLISLAQTKYWAQFGSQKVDLKRIDSGFINTDCDKCLALSFVNKEVNITRKETALKNPYSIACKKSKGKIRVGKLYSGHSQSFCFFKDKSFISANLFKVISK